jgi:hypothetical protein
LERRILPNASIKLITSKDGGYFSAGSPSVYYALYPNDTYYSVEQYGKAPTGNLHAIKLNPDGTKAWEREIPDIALNFG